MRAETAQVLAQIFTQFPTLEEHVGVASGSREQVLSTLKRAKDRQGAEGASLQRPSPWMRVVRNAAA